MATYELTQNEMTAIVTCRVFGALSDADARKLAIALQTVIVEARRRSPVLRILFDNREGAPLSPSAREALTGPLWSKFEPGDRTAILVSSSLSKVGARQEAREADGIFISESAALTWLNAWE